MTRATRGRRDTRRAPRFASGPPDNVHVERSPIHGFGLYASQRIVRGAYIGTYEGPDAKRNGTFVLWLTDDDGGAEGRRGENKLRYLNHSKRPNAEFDGYDLYARRTIKAGEEITFDYGWEGEHG